MKSIILFCTAAVIATGAFAQNQVNTTDVRCSSTKIMKKAGKIWVVTPMQDNETMSNGLVVEPCGVVKTIQGTTYTLGNGDCISMDGREIGLNEKEIDRVLIKNKRMWVATKLDKLLILDGNTSVLLDGTVHKSDGTKVVLKDNQIVNVARFETSTWKPVDAMALNSK